MLRSKRRREPLFPRSFSEIRPTTFGESLLVLSLVVCLTCFAYASYISYEKIHGRIENVTWPGALMPFVYGMAIMVAAGIFNFGCGA
ncbi:putative mitochondrial protein [Andalucia godoyi]|uniref:Putative mitochondrial protein n=1 Tax=Andalucia godoyi TaxID=505711 RepID=A0A8K0AGY7_ANDGO|nr:putative mitochondrial protein [Andalucia godoyi]|eukprot:ANDGO_08474.mRNA.1 putative mitochondrial protein